MIKIELATEQPIEDELHWSYPISELDYLFETVEDEQTYLLYNGRLYEEGQILGWISYHVEPIYNYKTRKYVIDRKTECDKLFNCNMVKNLGKYEVLKSRMVGSTYYAAVKMTTYATETDPEKVEVIAAIVLTAVESKSYHNFSYKDMDETVGPFKYDCPKSILDMLTPTESERAKKWRKICYDKIETKNDPNSLGKLPVGSIIQVVMPVDTLYYKIGDVVTLTKEMNWGSNRTGWYTDRARFTSRLMKCLEGHYDIIKRGE